MLKTYFNSLPLWQFENLSEPEGVRHFVTTREDGYGEGDFGSFNLGLNTGDDDAIVAENRQRLASSLGISIDDFITLRQIHSNKVIPIKSRDDIEHIKNHENNHADALVTNLAGIYLIVQVADCLPILLFDPVQKVTAAVHAGWRGTVKKIVRETIRMMTGEFGCAPENILAGIGPSIGPCCYEVGDDVVREVTENLSNADKLLKDSPSGEKKHLDLREANSQELTEAGLIDANIEQAGICTCCNSDEFYSYRCGSGRAGRFWAGIMLKGTS